MDTNKRHIMYTEEIELIWKPIVGFSRYEASNTGLLRSLNYKRSGKIVVLKPALSPDGYWSTVLLRDDGKYISIKVHRAVALAFYDCPTGLEINHIDGNKQNNWADNLEVVNRSENMRHAYKLGLMKSKVGSSNGNSKLTEDDVRNIRKAAAESVRESGRTGVRYYGRKALALQYGVSECTIKEVVSRRKNKFYNVP